MLVLMEKRKVSKTAWDTPVEGTGKEDSEQPAKGTGGWPEGGRETQRGKVLEGKDEPWIGGGAGSACSMLGQAHQDEN